MSKQPVSASYNRYGPWLRAKFDGERVYKVVIDATIFGFPWETREMMLAAAGELNRFPQIRFVKLHHLHVVQGSILSARYHYEPFPLFTLPQYTDFPCEFLPRLRPGIVIQRLFGLADPELLIAPKWELGKSSVQRFIDRTLSQRGIVQGSAA